MTLFLEFEFVFVIFLPQHYSFFFLTATENFYAQIEQWQLHRPLLTPSHFKHDCANAKYLSPTAVAGYLHRFGSLYVN